jgi:hypothetical protein
MAARSPKVIQNHAHQGQTCMVTYHLWRSCDGRWRRDRKELTCGWPQHQRRAAWPATPHDRPLKRHTKRSWRSPAGYASSLQHAGAGVSGRSGVPKTPANGGKMMVMATGGGQPDLPLPPKGTLQCLSQYAQLMKFRRIPRREWHGGQPIHWRRQWRV